MSFVTRYNVMPIAPIEAHTTWFDAGSVRIGVEYRLLNDAIAAAAQVAEAGGTDEGVTTGIDDRGVSLHINADQDGEDREFLRFDCFNEDPHYHYVSWRDTTNDMVHMDPIAVGDAIAWALERVRTRLPQMLERAGADEVARAVDALALERVLPKVTELAYRLRFGEHDEAQIESAAVAAEGRGA